MMTESVAALLSRLRFVGGPVETIYLNKTRVREHFIGQIGAIESFARTADVEASGETPVVKIGAKASSERSVTWTLSEPITQVLVLRAALEKKKSLYGPDSPEPGRYISFAGDGVISRPGLFDDRHREVLSDHPGLYDSLEAERAEIDGIISITQPPGRAHWLLTVSEGAAVCAAILDNQWLAETWPDWMRTVPQLQVLGLFRWNHIPGVPILATLHVGMKW